MARKRKAKSSSIEKIIYEALELLLSVGVPVNQISERKKENIAMAFLAVAGVKSSWKDVLKKENKKSLTSREIITYINTHFEENKSLGSYDDIRRRDLRWLVQADLILNNAKNPTASQNDPTRDYSLHEEFRHLVGYYGTDQWNVQLKFFNSNRPSFSDILSRKRVLPKIEIKLPSGQVLDFSRGKHNELQREVIQEFLPRYGYGCEVLYIGDAANRFLLREEEKLKELGFFQLSNDSLPDIIAYNSEKNWIYLIEVFYSSGPMSDERILELQKSLIDCKAGLIFITAFISKSDFKKHASEIGWESEVWTADNPDHLIHFNGGKFLGPY